MARSERPLASIMAAAAFSLAAPAQAQTVPASAPDRYAMPATAVWAMTSEAGRTYRIFVPFPSQGESPEPGYPVLYVLDGNAAFAAFAQPRWVQEHRSEAHPSELQSLMRISYAVFCLKKKTK